MCTCESMNKKNFNKSLGIDLVKKMTYWKLQNIVKN
jgi:hypothetical protein